MAEAGQPAETISLNFEKIKAKIKHPLKLFGFIPISISADIEINAENKVSVRFPWWSFLASGENEKNLGQRVANTLSSILEKNRESIGSIFSATE